MGGVVDVKHTEDLKYEKHWLTWQNSSNLLKRDGGYKIFVKNHDKAENISFTVRVSTGSYSLHAQLHKSR